MADRDIPIGPASNSLTAILGGGTTPKAPEEHKAVEKAEGVVKTAPPALLFKRGDIVLDTEKDVKATIVKPYIGLSNTGIPFHEVVSPKSGERWIQWQTNLKKK